MAKLQTLASRAEAASAMAEAEIALQSLKTAAAPQLAPEIGQAAPLLQQSTAEFDKRNYGGALYLANHAKNGGGGSRGRLASGVGRAPPARREVLAAPARLP